MSHAIVKGVPLRTRLTVPSLVLLRAPDPWRSLRIPLEGGRPAPPQVPARSVYVIGGEQSEIPLPGLDPFVLIELRDGDFASDAEGVYSRGAQRGERLPAYATIDVGDYSFMVVPPTPDGLGIPPDYANLTFPKSARRPEPCLLVKAGYQGVIDRKFVLHGEFLTIGGSLDTHIPLFRLRDEVAARLSKVGGDLSYFVEPTGPTKVRVSGPQSHRGLLTPFASIEIMEWSLVLLPGS
jgi:hypothetical protein